MPHRNAASLYPFLLLACIGMFACKSPQNSDTAQSPDLSSSQSAAASSNSVWIAKPDTAKSCAAQKGIPLDAMAGELEKAQIKILERKKLRDPRMRIQMCGVDRGDMNGYLIRKQDLEKSALLGFKAYKNPE